MSNQPEDSSRWWKASDGQWYSLECYPAAPHAAPGMVPGATTEATDAPRATVSEVGGRRGRAKAQAIPNRTASRRAS